MPTDLFEWAQVSINSHDGDDDELLEASDVGPRTDRGASSTDQLPIPHCSVRRRSSAFCGDDAVWLRSQAGRIIRTHHTEYDPCKQCTFQYLRHT